MMTVPLLTSGKEIDLADSKCFIDPPFTVPLIVILIGVSR